MRLLLCLAFLAYVTPSLQQGNNTTTNSTSVITATVAPTEEPAPPPPPPPSSSTHLDCPAYCPRIYRPVCARVSGILRTYANICLMRSAIRCARRRGVSARYRIHLVRRTHCKARRRRRPVRGGSRPRPRPLRLKAGNGGKT